MPKPTVVNTSQAFKKIAIFRALYLGDMLCIIPTVRAIRNAYPNAEITLIGLPWQSEFAKRYFKYFDDFIIFPGWPGLPEQEPDEEKINTFLQEVRTKQFDIIFQMQGNGMQTNYACMTWGSKVVTGLKRNDIIVTDDSLFPSSEDSDHEILRFQKLLTPLGISGSGRDLEFPFFENEVHRFEEIKAALNLNERAYVCVHPGARDPKRRWPLENFAFIANRLSEAGWKIVITGSLLEIDLLNALEEKLNYDATNIIRELGEVDLGTLAGIIKHSSMLVSNDTGVSHVASALKTPSVIIFSQNSLMQRWAPLDTTLHKSISHENANDPEYVLSIVLSHLLHREKENVTVFQ
jgi:ADP-heptose:LPS heptosyltransferase